MKITNSFHTVLFNNILNKAYSIYSENYFSLSCKTKIKGSLLYNFQLKNFVTYVDTGATINLFSRPNSKHICYKSLEPQRLRLLGIDRTTALKEI